MSESISGRFVNPEDIRSNEPVCFLVPMRRGCRVYYGIHESEFGRALVASSGEALRLVRFPGVETESSIVSRLLSAFPDAVPDPKTTKRFADLIGREGVRVPLEVEASEFRLSVWKALLAVPFGRAISYGGLAALAGRPGSVRAAAGAVASNQVLWFIPCHRVVRSDGGLGGFRDGLDLKLRMLRFEGGASP